MNTLLSLKKIITSVFAVGLMTAVGLNGGVAQARTQYEDDGTTTTTTPVFNEFYGVPNAVGDEADFVRVRRAGSTSNSDYVDTLSDACANGASFNVRTYIHNGADDDYNDNGNGSAVAHDVTLAMQAPLNTTSSSFTFTSTVSASNAASVTDTGKLVCNNGKTMKLTLVPGSVDSYSLHVGHVTEPDSAVNGSLKLGSRAHGSGDQWGCWNDRIIVVYTVKVEEIPEQPETPVYVCDLLKITRLGERRYRFSVDYTSQNGATFRKAVFNFGNGDTKTSTDKNDTSVEYAYPKAGTFDSFVTVHFTVDDKDVTAPGNSDCAKRVTAEKENCKIPGKENFPPNSPECRETPPELPHTGAGSIAGLFSITTVAGAFVHRLITNRRRI